MAAQVTQRANIPRWLPATSLREGAGTRSLWGEFLLGEAERIEAEDRASYHMIHRKWVTNLHFFAGEQLGFFDDSGQWQDVAREPGDPIYVVNIVQYFVQSLIKEWVRSRAALDVEPVADSIEARAGARPLAEFIKLNQRRVWTPTKSELEGKYCVITGNAFRYTRFNPDLGMPMKIPNVEEKEVSVGGSAYYCSACQKYGDASELDEDAPKCPECGSPKVAISKAPTAKAQIINGFSTRQSGDADTVVIDPFEIKLALRANDVNDSSYLRRQRLILENVMRATFEWARFEPESSSGRGGTEDLGLQYQRQIERSAGNVNGYITSSPGQREDDGLGRYRQYWIEPERYMHFVWQEDERMADGEVVKRGTRARDLFEKGYYFGVSSSVVLDSSHESKRDHWDQLKWSLMPGSVWGHGIEHMVEQNLISNDFFSLAYEAAMHSTIGRTVINPTLLDRDEWKNRPGHVAVMRTGVTRNDRPSEAAAIITPAANFGALESLGQSVKNDMRLTSGGAFNTASGVGDSEANTATATAILRDQALSMMLPQLVRKSEADIATGLKWLRIIKRFDLYEVYFKRISMYSEFELKQARSLDPDYDLIIEPRVGSILPQSELEKLQSFEKAASLGGIPGGIFNVQVFPEHIRRLLCDYLNLPFEADKSQVDQRNTMLRIQKLLELAEELEEAHDQGQQALAAGMIQPTMQPGMMPGAPPPPIGPSGMPSMPGAPVTPAAPMQPGPNAQQNPAGMMPGQPTAMMPAGAPPIAHTGVPELDLLADPAFILSRAAEVAPVQYRYDDHPVCLETIRDWFKRDEGISASPLVQLLINDLYSRHLQGMQMAQMEMAMAAAGPAALMGPPPGAPQGGPSGGGPSQPKDGRPPGDASPGTGFVKPVSASAVTPPLMG